MIHLLHFYFIQYKSAVKYSVSSFIRAEAKSALYDLEYSKLTRINEELFASYQSEEDNIARKHLYTDSRANVGIYGNYVLSCLVDFS